MLNLKMFIPILLLLLGFWPVGNVMGSIHRVRVDLKVRSPNLLKEKAEQMSKPFPHHGEPLSWAEVIEMAGRTNDEMHQLVTKLSDGLDGKNVKECPSKQCIVADVNVDDDEILESVMNDEDSSETTSTTDKDGVEDFVHRRLRRLLEDSGHDHTIVSGVRRLSMPDSHNGDSTGQRRTTSLKDDDNVPEEAKQNKVFSSISRDISKERQEVTYETLDDGWNNLQFMVIPAICDQDEKNGYLSMEKAQSRSQGSCPTEIKLTVTPWYAEDVAVSNSITYTIFTEYLDQTETCSEYNATICENSLEPALIVDNVYAGDLSIYLVQYDEIYNTFKFRDDTVLRILELGQFLDPGVAYYNIQLDYPEWNITTLNSTVYAYPGPVITPDYGKERYNVPKGHQGAGLGVTALSTGMLNAYSEDALNAFLTGFDLPVPKVQLLESSVFQGNNLSACFDTQLYGIEPCGESNLDVQSITSYGVGAEFGFLPGGQEKPPANQTLADVFVSYREAFIENNVTPDIISLSYGQPSFYIPGDFDNYIMMEFTAVGITILAASGDRGAAGESFFGLGPCSPTEYYPRGQAMLPSGSPWILSVGATMEADLDESDGLGPAACMGPVGGMITSTGMIQPSHVVELPDYQKTAVEGYLNSDAYKNWPFKASFGSPGRGIPDVAAYGNNIPKVVENRNGELSILPTGGTSASSPTFAGLLLQVRGALLSSPECEGIDVKFGHINPMIYWAAENRPDAFTDITVGNNVFDGQSPELNTVYCGIGYVATKGWDPVTGVGMMNFPGFVEAAKEYYCTGIE